MYVYILSNIVLLGLSISLFLFEDHIIVGGCYNLYITDL